ncbi:MAG TPA: alcohol dehydrogenase [Candidatus Binataceae bacterium]|nr:alcohol dehydrogenase [Candidatus Binataceae bacterium]
MRSYDLIEFNAPLRMVERPTPAPQGSEVLLRVLACGVCHSDVHLWEGFYDLGAGKRLGLADRGLRLPLTPGHENVGEVVAVGPRAQGVKVGEQVLVFPWIGCGRCSVCARGEEQLCLQPRSLGLFLPGGFADHLLVPEARYLFPVGDLDPVKAAPYACSGLTTYGALKKVGRELMAAQPILIIGAGGLGLMALSILKAMGGRGAIVAEIDPSKRQAALAAGALAAIDSAAPDAAAQIIAAAGAPLWAAVDLVGAPSTVRMGLDSLVKGGKLIIVGLFGGEITLPLPLIPMRATTIQGSYVGSPGELGELIELVRRTGLPAVPVTTRPLDQASDALADLHAGRLIGRAVLRPE